jgi:alkaline phosphatase D
MRLYLLSGLNDGCKTYPFRKESQKEFLDFFEEPADSPRRKQEVRSVISLDPLLSEVICFYQGIYASYTVGAEDKKVKFILLDNRYHKDPYGTPNGDFLGETQWKWLEKEISSTTSAVAFTVIVSGIQILPNDRFFGGESWSRFPVQRERLLQLLLNSNAKGVILLRYGKHE